MSRKCEICGKDVASGKQISHSHRVSNRKWFPNVQKVKAVVNGTTRRISVCTKCLKAGKVQRAI